MKHEGGWQRPVVLGIIAAVGISGIIEALPHASESLGDLTLDAVILAAIMIGSALLARRLRAKH